MGEVVTFEETGTYKLLFQIFADRPEELISFYEQTIAPLVRYDEQYQTELVGTLSTYLGHDCNLAATASTLYTHRHTVRYRLDRIAELSGLDIAKTDDREKLSLGLKAMRLLGRRVSTVTQKPRRRAGRRLATPQGRPQHLVHPPGPRPRGAVAHRGAVDGDDRHRAAHGVGEDDLVRAPPGRLVERLLVAPASAASTAARAMPGSRPRTGAHTRRPPTAHSALATAASPSAPAGVEQQGVVGALALGPALRGAEGRRRTGSCARPGSPGEPRARAPRRPGRRPARGPGAARPCPPPAGSAGRSR